MPGIYQYDVEIKSNVAKLLSDMKQVQDRLDTVEGKEYKIKLNVDEKKLSSVISNLEKMLDSLGKGTGDFKQFENLSKELSSVVSEVQSLSKAFGKVDDSGTKTLLSSIQNIDKSLSELSQHILNVNKNMGNMGGNTSGAVKQVENIGNAAADAVKQVDKLADAQSKTNVANGLDSSISKYQEIVSLVKEYYELTSKIKQPTLKRQSRSEDYDRIDGYLLKKAPQKVGTTDIEKDINDRYHKMAKGVNEGSEFAIKAMKSAIQRYWSDVTEMPSDEKLLSSRKVIPYGNKGQKEEYIIPKKYQDLEKSVIQETIAMNQNNAAYEEEQKQIKANNAAIEERLNLIRQSIKQNNKNSDYNGEYKMGLSLKASDRNKKDIFGMTSDLSQEEMLKEICNMLGVEIPQNAEKAKQAIKEVSSTPQESNISSGMKDAFPDKDISASVESATNSIKEENNVLEQNTQKVKENTQAKEQNANANLNKYDKRLDSYNGKIDKYQATIDRFNDGGWTSDTYLKNVQAVRDAVKQYATLLDNIKTNQNGIATDEDIQNLDEYEKKIKDTIATVTNMSASEKGYSRLAGQKEIDKINKILRENSAMSSEAKAKIKAYKQELISGNPSVSLEKIHGKILKIVNAEELAGRAGRSMFDVIKEKAFYGFAAQIGMYFGFNDIINGFKQVASTIRELDTAYTEMRKVSDESAQSLKNFQKESFSTADSVGTTALAMQDATATWMRLGESLDDAKESAKDATVLLNVSEFDNIDEATDSLVAMSQAYKDLDKMEIIDVLDKIGNEYSISTDQLSTALKDSAAVLKTQGNDLAESVALITAGKVITCIYRNIYNRMNLIAGNA
jgi:methyl-accepting chemotaxis protein